MTDNPDEIVGHKTFDDGAGGYRHEPLTRAEADAIWESVEASNAQRAADMPDDQAALRALTEAFVRLRELGWRDARYAPKDGTEIELIEPGCSRAARGYWRYHNGRDGAGCFWVPAAGDEWPSKPILFRPLPTKNGDQPT